MEHELKAWPDEFDASKRGDKPYEFRLNDRGFAVGDTLVIRKWNPNRVGDVDSLGNPIGRWVRPDGEPAMDFWDADTLRGTVTHALYGGRFGVPEGYCVMGVRWETADAK